MKNILEMRVKCRLVDARTGHIERDFPWKKNLVLDAALNSLAQRSGGLGSQSLASIMTYCQVGSGTNPNSFPSGSITFTQVGTAVTAIGGTFFTAAMGGGILKYGKNPNTARLFLSWLATPEGAITFEKMTKRGNFFVAGTETAKLLKDRKLSYFTSAESIAQAKKLNALEAAYSRELAGR